ncbi:hypothetical protein J0S82_016324 [Galemys pyrenaicus]|uniref:Uncharacterized protein n=1 Tax=Galemys pyrenaicus TaxID=202257 RepID=A0A8J6DFD2_GALPY|nr:hypothetical protein J0S82_016324 [Galemys pyrenaicus]
MVCRCSLASTVLARRLSWAPPLLLFCSCSRAWCGFVSVRGARGPETGTFPEGLRTRALRSTLATWQGAQEAAAAGAQERRVAQDCVARWRSHVRGRRVDRQLRRAWAQQALVAWRAALGQRREARQRAEERGPRAQAGVALCWTLWVRETRQRRLSRAHAARRLSARWVPRACGQPLAILPLGASGLCRAEEGLWELGR